VNIQTGLFRAWVVLAVLWIGYVLATWPTVETNRFGPYIRMADGKFSRDIAPAWLAEHAGEYIQNEFQHPLPTVPWRRSEILFTLSKGERCVDAQGKPVGACAAFSTSFEKRDAQRRTDYLSESLPLAFGPPAAAFALGLALAWVFSGFRVGAPRRPPIRKAEAKWR
jgi:hypothetical protein